MEGTEGIIFNIQRFCVNDGEGIRTVVFCKGCPLRCAWCHNPDGISFEPEIARFSARCKQCGACERVCPEHCFSEGKFERARCTLCGKCAEVCPNGAIEKVGKRCSAEEVAEACARDMPYYAQSRGGVTLSGGEPLAQIGFAVEVLRLLKARGISAAVETSGNVPGEHIRLAAEYADFFLYDFKAADGEVCRRYTGSDGALALSNLQILEKMGKRVILRCPLIPGVNDGATHFAGIARVANAHACIERAELLPYHNTGVGKYAALGKTCGFVGEAFSAERLRAMRAEISSHCQKEVVFA